MTSTACPCNNITTYSDCCEPFHTNKTSPDTAEQLMRSRYSAYVLKLVDYIVATTHPVVRSETLAQDVANGMDETIWTGLKIIKTASGGKKDKTGKVEFIASYTVKGEAGQLHEYSRFKKHHGKWCYLDGILYS